MPRLLNLNKPAIAQFSDLPAMSHSVPCEGALPGGEYRQNVRNQRMWQGRHEGHKPIEEANPRQRLRYGGKVSILCPIGGFNIRGQFLIEKQWIWQHLRCGKRQQHFSETITVAFKQVVRDSTQ
jgi:hypothetical protein